MGKRLKCRKFQITVNSRKQGGAILGFLLGAIIAFMGAVSPTATRLRLEEL